MTDEFIYRGATITDVWPAGAQNPGSQTRFMARRREDGFQRWKVTMPAGGVAYAFTKREARALIRDALIAN